MDRLLIRDVRSFRGDHAARLAPITLLVGENSSGKSTFLSLLRVAWDIGYGLTEPSFNEDPFQLGAYDDIAHYHGGQGRRAKSFRVGFEAALKPGQRRLPTLEAPDLRVEGLFTPQVGQPSLHSLSVMREPWGIEATQSGESIGMVIHTPGKQYAFSSAPEFGFPTLTTQTVFFLLEYLAYSTRADRKPAAEGELPPTDEMATILRLLGDLAHPAASRRRTTQEISRPYAIAPIRTKPRRTYDPLKESPSPEGEHVPFLLSRLSVAEPSTWRRLAKDLSAFGSEAGLFEEIRVKHFEKKEAAPFQLRIKLKGQRADANLMDVGYGVSQVLPILVDCLTAPPSTFFLMQQPEVHLHPRAQAELGSFITSLTMSRQHQFAIETHSDHLIDRIRVEIRRKKLAPHLVSLLYFERDGSRACIHQLSFDELGNLRGQPPTYRSFFIREELDLLSTGQVS